MSKESVQKQKLEQKEKEKKKNKVIEVCRATYGPPQAEKNAPWKMRFVTQKLQDFVDKSNSDTVAIDERLNGLFGDPSPGVRKVLSVEYKYNGIFKQASWGEGSTVYLQGSGLELAHAQKRTCKSPESYLVDVFNPDVLRIVLSFLDVYPDMFNCLLVSKSWKESVKTAGMTSKFTIGAHGMPGPVYLDMPLGFVQFIITRAGTRLEELDLSSYEKINDSVLQPVLSNSVRLRILRLNYCTRLTNTSINVIARCLKLEQLELKELRKIDDAPIALIAQNCLKLKSVNLSGCSRLTDKSVSLLCKNLSSLNALYLKHCHLVTDKSISMLGKAQSRSLEELGLWSLHRLTNDAFNGLASSRMSKLRSLVLTGCVNVDFNGIRLICNNCKSLVQLNLSYCHRLKDKSIIYISNNLPRLEHLNLHYLLKITDKSLVAIGQNLPLLRSLNLTRCNEVTPEAIAYLCLKLTQLNELFVRSCAAFTDDGTQLLLQSVRKRHGKLDLLDLRQVDSISGPKTCKLLSEVFEQQYKSVNSFFFTKIHEI